mmetsp:Transcript_77651/g.155532  ORF Transcript_77651/g.155532 Transcript_77651/m.155532 type:complete len:581 (-) Transcript_77651:56-1798(-)
MASLRVAMRLSMLPTSSGTAGQPPMLIQTQTSKRKTVVEEHNPGRKVLPIEKKTRLPKAAKTSPKSTATTPQSSSSTSGKKQSAATLNLPERSKLARRACSVLADVEVTHTESLEMLASLIASGKRVVVITGAGLSCASGIPPFRASRAGASTDGGAIWSANVEAMGTRTSFLRDPRHWYTSFWLPSFSPAKMRKEPNAGHQALAALCHEFSNLRLVTQNVDGLHSIASAAVSLASTSSSESSFSFSSHPSFPSPSDRLIEAHGRVGLYKCSSALPEDGGTCVYASEASISPEHFPEATRLQLGHGVDQPASMPHPPKCPSCGAACLPQALLFDEDYSDHAFYQFDKLQDWMSEADAFLFVGTSFAVTLTSLAVEEARLRRLPMFNVNIDDDPERTARPTLRWHDIVGRAEEKLPRLLDLVTRHRKRHDHKETTTARTVSTEPPEEPNEALLIGSTDVDLPQSPSSSYANLETVSSAAGLSASSSPGAVDSLSAAAVTANTQVVPAAYTEGSSGEEPLEILQIARSVVESEGASLESTRPVFFSPPPPSAPLVAGTTNEASVEFPTNKIAGSTAQHPGDT